MHSCRPHSLKQHIGFWAWLQNSNNFYKLDFFGFILLDKPQIYKIIMSKLGRFLTNLRPFCDFTVRATEKSEENNFVEYQIVLVFQFD